MDHDLVCRFLGVKRDSGRGATSKYLEPRLLHNMQRCLDQLAPLEMTDLEISRSCERLNG